VDAAEVAEVAEAGAEAAEAVAEDDESGGRARAGPSPSDGSAES
jgi:hypothetical protein